MSGYTGSFYARIAPGSQESGRVMAGYLNDWLALRSVLDVGCGAGAWLAGVAAALGDVDYVGVDGSYVQADQLLIPAGRFQAVDVSQHFDLARRFDLVVSLEVAEHVPPQDGDAYLDNLVRHGDAILLSAAAPHQGGTEHVNEQWPGYWAGRLAARGYEAIDLFRPTLWAAESVSWWYRQNAVLYLASGHARADRLREQAARAWTGGPPAALVHPQMWAIAVSHLQHGPASGPEGANRTPRQLARLLRRRIHPRRAGPE